ncbi:zinc ribbon domain-containing protein [Haloferula sp. A504]|uniref:zinc ribbon domain-containing protein n=1 Tax=Haloferula sp. A504 TaxID=3373601 RepID=UPI0031BED9DB|nr:transposase [Verrucomicrobiaceae bacterium E54]
MVSEPPPIPEREEPPPLPEDLTAEVEGDPIVVSKKEVPRHHPDLRGSAAEVRSLERHVCPECGGKGEWSAAKRKLLCPYCGTEFDRVAPPPMPDISEHDLDAMLARLGDKATTIDTSQRKVQCTHCHAVLTRDASNVGQSCDFCGSPEMLDYEDIEAPVSPESLLPAVIGKEKAYHSLKSFLASKWFAPNDLKKRNLVDRIHGVYLPYWTFDSAAECPWTADSGTYYYVTRTRRGSDGKTETYRERKIRWRPARGHVSTWFDDILVTGSTGLDPTILSKLEPFPTHDLVPYETRYVSGWNVEAYQVPLMQAARTGFGIMEGQLRTMCAREVPGDTYRNLRIYPEYSRKTFKHILCPVWLIAYQYRGKTYNGAINAVTGTTYAHFPKSPWKIALVVVAVLAVLLVIFLLIRG